MNANDVVITAGVRTPFGKLGGALSSLSAVDLGAAVIREALERSKISGEQVGHGATGRLQSGPPGRSPRPIYQ